MNKRTRLIVSIVIPVVLVLFVLTLYIRQQQVASSSLPSSSSSPAAKGPLTTVRLALDWTPNTNHTGIYVALKNGWYRDQGIDLKILPYSSNVSSDVLVSSGQAQVGISATESIVSDMAVGQPVVSIAAIIQHNTSALVTLASSGLTRPRDLDGKVYGGFGAPYEAAVVGEIIKNDGGRGVFKNVTLDIDTMQALESKRIDFAWVYEGWEVIQAQRDGYKLNVFPITSYGVADYYTPNIITSPKEIQQHSDLLRRFMLATSQGYTYARTHPQQAAQILLTSVPSGTFADSGLVVASQEYLSPRYVDPGRKWGLQDASSWQGYPQFMLNAGAVLDAAGKPVKSMNFDQLFTNQFIE